MKAADLVDRFRSMFPGEDTANFQPWDFIHRFGSPLWALLYAQLFWPSFVEIDDMVFLESEFEDADDRRRLRDCSVRLGGDRRLVEEAFNVKEIPTLFGRRAGETNDYEDVLLAELIADMWASRLQAQFPTREFVVSVLSPEESGGDIAVLFRQQD